MPDLDERFATLDRIPVPDLRAERASDGSPDGTPTPPFGWGLGRRLGVIATAFLVFGAAVAYGWHAVTTTSPPTPPRPGPVADPLAGIASGWTQLPDPPEQPSGAADLWTGTDLIDWGGYVSPGTTGADPYQAGGYAFDPETQRWSAIPDAPGARTGATAVWTGSEALFLFGWDGSRTYADGFAFDPATATWRTTSPAPFTPDAARAVWTGTEVIVWGHQYGKDAAPGPLIAAYDPSSDRWHAIADPPIDLNAASLVWNGDRLFVFGSLLDRRNHASTDTSVGETYDPSTDTWTSLPPSDLSPQATSAVWIGSGLLAWDYDLRSQTYDPSPGRWSELDRIPMERGECYPDSALVGNEVFAFYCGQAATYDLASATWERLHGGMLAATIDSNGNAYRLWRFADLVPAGDVLFLSAEGLTVTKGGEPCYGCSGSPTSFWAFRP